MTTFSVVLALLIIASIGFLRWYLPDVKSLSYNLNTYAERNYQEKGRYVQAEKIYDYIIQNPDLVEEETYLQFALCLQHTGNHKKSETVIVEGIQDLDRRISETPDHLKLHLIKGKLYGLLQEDDLKVKEFQILEHKAHAAIREASNNYEKSDGFYRLAQMYFESGQIEKAIDHIEKAIAHAESRADMYYLYSIRDEYLDRLEQDEQ